jgi:hypothetical protein
MDLCLDWRVFEYLFSVKPFEHCDLYTTRFLVQKEYLTYSTDSFAAFLQLVEETPIQMSFV